MPTTRKNNQQIQREMDLTKNTLRANQSKEKVILYEILESLKLKFIEHKGFFAKLQEPVIVDAYLGKPYRVAIEVDALPVTNQMHEIRKELYLYGNRRHLIRFLANDLISNPEKVSDKILEFLDLAKKVNTEERLRKKRPILVERAYELN